MNKTNIFIINKWVNNTVVCIFRMNNVLYFLETGVINTDIVYNNDFTCYGYLIN